MKIKSLYIYGVAIILVIAIILITSTDKTEINNEIINDPNAAIPQDDNHKGLSNNKGSGPSKSDVKPEFWENLDKIGQEVEANPKDTLKLRKYAELLSMAHQTDKALEQYEKILNMDPKRVDILLSEGLLYFNEGKYDKAEEVTNRVLKIDKNHREAEFNLGVIAASQGEKEEARKIWTKLVENNPGTEAAQFAEEALKKL